MQLIMGAGAQMISWPEGFCARLARRGLQAIRFDHRDAGHSSHFPGGPAPDLPVLHGIAALAARADGTA